MKLLENIAVLNVFYSIRTTYITYTVYNVHCTYITHGIFNELLDLEQMF